MRGRGKSDLGTGAPFQREFSFPKTKNHNFISAQEVKIQKEVGRSPETFNIPY